MHSKDVVQQTASVNCDDWSQYLFIVTSDRQWQWQCWWCQATMDSSRCWMVHQRLVVDVTTVITTVCSAFLDWACRCLPWWSLGMEARWLRPTTWL